MCGFHREPARLAVLACAPLVLTLAAACGSDAGQPPATGALRQPDVARFEVVATQDVTPVVVVDATVAAYPRIVVTAPVDGIPVLAVETGAVVATNQQVGSIGGRSLTAPVDGKVVAIPAPAGVSVPQNAPLLVIQYAGFGAAAVVDPADAYRAQGDPVAGRANLQHGAAGFECSLARPEAIQDGGAQQGSDTAPAPSGAGGPTLLCLIPKEIRAYEGERIQIGLEYPTVTGALVLPVGSVSGSAQSGTVRRYSDSSTGEQVSVQLGVSDGVVIQIVSGLSVGDRVSATPPELGGP
jgi:membrane fusion protein, macrolide-specific efflux system